MSFWPCGKVKFQKKKKKYHKSTNFKEKFNRINYIKIVKTPAQNNALKNETSNSKLLEYTHITNKIV